MLAFVLSGVFWLQAGSPRSMLGAIRRLEFERIDAATRSKRRSETTWADVFAVRDKAVIARADKDAHFALERLLKLVIDVEHKRLEPAAAVAQGADLLGRVTGNRVARLAYAALQDMRATGDASAEGSAADRLRAMRDVIEAEPLPTRATLHNAAFLELMRGVLRGFFARPDVSASLAPALYHYEIRNHHEALPIIVRRLRDLADALQDQGRPQDADDCLRWAARSLLGLMASETDAGTRLLCADLLARCAPPESKVAARLRDFRTAFHAAVLRADVDLADQAFVRKRSVAPGPYRVAVALLVAGLAVAAMALGGACALVAGLLAMPFARIFRRRRSGNRETPHASTRTAGRRARAANVEPAGWPCPRGSGAARATLRRTRAALLVPVPPAVLTLLIVARFQRHGPYSTYWLLALAVLAVCAGVLGTMILAALRHPGTPARRTAARTAAVLLAAGVVLMPALPPKGMTRVLRSLDLAVGLPWVGIPVILALVASVAWLARPRARALAIAGAFAWCGLAAVAFGLYECHRAADGAYQTASVEGHRDEVAARLGSDWQDRFLKPAFDAYGVPGP